MKILNHLDDLSEFGIEYTEEDKNIFVEFENVIKDAGYNIEYMNAPVDIIKNNILAAISIKFDNGILSGADMYSELIEYITAHEKYKFIFDNNVYIYKLSKQKTIRNDETSFIFTIRIGSSKI